jgi:hypothetical protein
VRQCPSLTNLTLNNVNGRDNITGTTFNSLTQLLVNNASGFHSFNNKVMPLLTDLELIGTDVRYIDDNISPNLQRLHLAQSVTGINSIINLNPSLAYIKLDSINVNTFDKCNMSSLQELYIVGNNQLTTLNLTDATKLITLVIEQSRVINFNSYNLPSLVSLFMNNTAPLSSITFKSFPKLINITLININIP